MTTKERSKHVIESLIKDSGKQTFEALATEIQIQVSGMGSRYLCLKMVGNCVWEMAKDGVISAKTVNDIAFYSLRNPIDQGQQSQKVST